MKETQFDVFTVHNINDKYSFLHVDVENEAEFLKNFTEYIFKEENLLKYTNIVIGQDLKLGNREYTALYKEISNFLNKKLEERDSLELDEEVEKLLFDQEYIIKDNDTGKLLLQNDKIGKLGEYIFHLLLTNYFEYTCIIPKIKLTTNRNMSVFGIDALFYNEKENELLFGESKFSRNIQGGISLINKSLEGYKESIQEEYLLVISSDNYKLHENFIKKYSESIQGCISFEEFIEFNKINKITIPIFIAHGEWTKIDIERVMNELDKVNQSEYFGLKTKFILISLPMIDKDKFVATAISVAKKKQEEYERNRK